MSAVLYTADQSVISFSPHAGLSDALAPAGSVPELLELSVALGRRAALFRGVCVPERTRVSSPRSARVCGHGTAARLRRR